MNADRAERVRVANHFIGAIAAHGRRFFAKGDRVSRFELDGRGRVWFVDCYKDGRVYTHTKPWARWRDFTEGGTLRRLVEALRDYIMGRAELPVGMVAPERTWTAGDIWGYGPDEAAATREACRMLTPPVSAAEEENDGR